MFLLVVASEKKFHDRISFYHFIKKGGKKEKRRNAATSFCHSRGSGNLGIKKGIGKRG
jgi:hypothetical protein